MERINWFERISEKKYFILVFFLIAFLFLSLFSWSTSPFYIYDGMDSAVFKTMGQALLKGKILYKDIFDHKGPYLYFINALGQWMIPGHLGIFLLQVSALGIAMWYLFRTAHLFLKSFPSLICMLLSLLVLAMHLNDGNQCEEWMMYALCIAFYYVCSYFAKDSSRDHPLSYSFIYGLCFGFTFFIRPNDAVAWIGGLMTGIVLWLFYCKKYKNTALNILCFTGGFSLMAIPVLVYFGDHNTLPEMWYGLIGFNKEYSGGILLLFKSCLMSRKLFLLLLFVPFFGLVYTSKYRSLLFVTTPAFALAILLTGSNLFLHYFICFTPFFLLLFSFVALQSLKNNYLRLIALCLCLLAFERYNNRYSVINLPMIRWYSYGHHSVYKQAKRLFDFIPDCERDSVWNYNLAWEGKKDGVQSEISIFCHYGIVPCNKILIGKNEQLERDDLISIHCPKWIIFQQSSWQIRTTARKDSSYIASHYDIVAQSDTTICKLTLYRRMN